MGILRLLLALTVIASHSTPILGLRMIPGNCSVEIFFIISGFYMALILRGKYVGQAHSTRLFYENRFLRLYPTYLTCVFLSWGLFLGEYALMHKAPPNSWMYMYRMMGWRKMPFILSNWTMLGLDIPLLLHYSRAHGFTWFAEPALHALANGSDSCFDVITIRQAWSIGAEVWFYLLAPLIVRRSLPCLLVPLALSLAVKFCMEHVFQYDTYYFFPAQCCFFLLGTLLQRVYERFQNAAFLPQIARVCLPLIVISILSLGSFGNSYIKYGFYTGFCVSLPAIFALSKKWQIDRHVGNLSYSVYLLHWIVIKVLHAARVDTGTLAAIITICGSVVIYIFVERPIDVFRQSLLARRRSIPASGESTSEMSARHIS